MKPAAERKQELTERLEKAAKENAAAEIASAIVDSIDQALRDRGRPGRRDRDAEPRD